MLLKLSSDCCLVSTVADYDAWCLQEHALHLTRELKLRLEPNCDRITCHMLLKNRPLIWRCRRDICASSQPNPNHTTKLDLSKDGTTGGGTTLSGAQVQLTSLNSLRLLDNLLALSEDQLDVTWVRHVWVDLKPLVVVCGCNL